MPFLAVKGAVHHVAGIGQRGGELTVKVGVVFDYEKAQGVLRLLGKSPRRLICHCGTEVSR